MGEPKGRKDCVGLEGLRPFNSSKKTRQLAELLFENSNLFCAIAPFIPMPNLHLSMDQLWYLKDHSCRLQCFLWHRFST